jgi:hypothetical protein
MCYFKNTYVTRRREEEGSIRRVVKEYSKSPIRKKVGNGRSVCMHLE